MSLVLEGVSRQFGRRVVLKDLNLDLADGDAAVLRGANGSGKTTLLRLAATVLRPTDGTVRIHGDTGAAARRHLAFVPHDAPTYRELSPLDHLRFATEVHGKAMSRADAARCLADAGLGKSATEMASLLSRGQRQRLALAMALAVRPRLLLLDEPFTALDADGIAWATEAINSFEGTVLAAVHGDAGFDSNRTLQLDGGRLQ